MSERFAPQRPYFQIGQHISERTEPLTDLEYGHLLNFGVSRNIDLGTALLGHLTDQLC